MRCKIVSSFMAAVLGIALFIPAAPAGAQEGKVVGYVMDSRGEIRPVRKLAKSEIPFYYLVKDFYWHILVAYRHGDAALHEEWRLLGVKPDSPEANSILKATFRAQALDLDITIPPIGDSDEEFLKAQYRNHQREIAELQGITLAMLRELRSNQVALEHWESYLESKIRPTISSTIYGEEGHYDKLRKRLIRDFEVVVRGEIATSGAEEP